MIQREEIEKIRHELHALGSERGLNDPLVLQKSQLLDAMLNQFMQRAWLRGKAAARIVLPEEYDYSTVTKARNLALFEFNFDINV